MKQCPTKINTFSLRRLTFLPDLLKSFSLSALYKHKYLNTHIIEAKVPILYVVRNMRIANRRHLVPLYCLWCYKTIFMFFCPLSNWDILKTSNNTWLDQTGLSAVQICFCSNIHKVIPQTDRQNTFLFSYHSSVMEISCCLSNVSLKLWDQRMLGPPSKGDQITGADSEFKQNSAAVSKFQAEQNSWAEIIT